jgi:hypothetical protein
MNAFLTIGLHYRRLREQSDDDGVHEPEREEIDEHRAVERQHGAPVCRFFMGCCRHRWTLSLVVADSYCTRLNNQRFSQIRDRYIK